MTLKNTYPFLRDCSQRCNNIQVQKWRILCSVSLNFIRLSGIPNICQRAITAVCRHFQNIQNGSNTLTIESKRQNLYIKSTWLQSFMLTHQSGIIICKELIYISFLRYFPRYSLCTPNWRCRTTSYDVVVCKIHKLLLQ